MKHQSVINRDFKSHPVSAGVHVIRLRPAYLIFAALATVISLVLWISNPEPASATRHVSLDLGNPDNTTPADAALNSSDYGFDPQILASPAAGIAVQLPGQSPAPDSGWHEITVKSGDSLAGIFSRVGISASELHALLKQGGATHNLKKIYPGQILRLMTNDDHKLLRLTYKIDELSTLEVSRNGDELDISTTHRTPERRVTNASGSIDNSLFVSAQAAGLSDSMTMELAGIFGWDIDFVLDIRKGDQFTVLYEELYLDGERIGNGDILAAEFINQGVRYQAVRYTDAGGKTDFYSLDGKSMRKAFLRTPVEFSRISSGFSLGRKHPILNRIRAHKGVDYAAATGTPIKSTSNGKIVYRGKKGGYGNTVIIQHGTKYSTLYAHMSKFRGGLKTGSRVKQGQVIGYIGSSGLATGPHLHYEFRVDGVHRDPLKVKLPGAEPLDSKYIADFSRKAESLLAQLDLVRNVQVAVNSSSN
ncbi:MAG TPA: peptidoglycan DD-metalloendopeptidase family protein [Gammaproteobacteria bacterium]|nr:peptidoglycan DD-metalloendopeptidase family protein [Gammaproteobacteria bacterium]